MSDETIIQNRIAALGQSQDERLPEELGVHYADVDERTPASLLAYAESLAREVVPFVNADGTPTPGGWLPLFQRPAEPPPDGETRPALALFAAFLQLYEFPRAAINRLTARHLDFFYHRVLRFEPRMAAPDRAHVTIVLKKGAPPVRVLPSHLLSAGKDASGAERLYSPTFESIVNTARIESLRSIVVDRTPPARVRFAPVADSSDGLGGPLPEESPKWHPFGHAGLPTADVGFAIASPVLRMKEGRRVIKVSLAVEGGEQLTTPAVKSAFNAFLTGEKQWIGPRNAVATLSAGQLEFTIEVPDGDPAVVDYDPKVHAHAYTAGRAPVLQLLMKPDQPLDYHDVSRVTVTSARLSVDVQGLTALTLESDAGTLDPKKVFLPFGPQPVAGSRFMIGCDEALSKCLSRLDLTLQWKGAPRDFSSQYAGYTDVSTVRNTTFTASAAFQDRASAHTREGEALFDSADATRPAVLHLIGTAAPAEPRRSDGEYVFALSRGGTSWSRREAQRRVMLRPVAHSFLLHAPEPRRGFIVLTLDRSFLHAEYRQQSVTKMLERIRDSRVALLQEPYTPAIQRLSLSYAAHTTDVRVSSTSAGDFADLDVQLFHVGPFGQMRDHGHQRAALGFVSDTRVPLVPAYEGRGELLIGLSGLTAGDSVSILFQVAEGSADPDVPAERPEWFVLGDNYWKKLGAAEVVRDTTNLLLTSGIVTFVIPKEATTANTIMPAGLIWLKATVSRERDPDATCQLVGAIANAVEVQFVMDSEDAAAAHLATALPQGSIARLVTSIGPVSKVRQPYPSFGGRPREGSEEVRTRAAERLRHKNRASAPWDYERLVLGAFPSVHRVKCIPHAAPGSWMAPGHTLIVVVPDLRNRNAPDPLQPKVDADTIVRITDYLAAHVSGHVRLAVKNAAYQRIRVACRVKFHAGYELNFYRQEMQRALIQFLSPWAFDASRPVTFGGRVYGSVLLDFVEELPFVDYVTDFKMSTFVGPAAERRDVGHATPETPDAILVSDATHEIAEAD